MIGVWTGNALPQPALFGEWAIKNAYHAFSEGQYPTSDSGCDEVFALNLWAHDGFAPDYANPHKILAWVEVDAANSKEVTAALWLFEGLMSGVELPDAWINPPPSGDGFTFDVAGDAIPTNGHCMTHFSWDAGGMGCATWGMYGRITHAALARYMTPANGGALYAAISQDALIRATGKAPNGFDAAQLLADARRIGFAHLQRSSRDGRSQSLARVGFRFTAIDGRFSMIPMLTALALVATSCEFARNSAEAAAAIAATRPDSADLATIAEMRRIERDAICKRNAQH